MSDPRPEQVPRPPESLAEAAAAGLGPRAEEPPLGPIRLALFTPVREYPPLADRKASALLAAFGLMSTVLLFFTDRFRTILTERGYLGDLLVFIPLAPLVVLITVGSWFAIRALMRPAPPMPESMANYPHIVGLGREAYRDRVRGMSYDEVLRDMLHYNYSVASLSAVKFRALDRSLRCLRLSFALWAVLMALATFAA